MVEELISALGTAESEMREELVVKTAILAERYQENIRWYLDSMIEMIAIAGGPRRRGGVVSGSAGGDERP